MDSTATKENLKQLVMMLLVVLCFIFICGEGKIPDVNPCTSQTTCAKCIQKDPRCAWCSQEDFTKRKIPRCDLVENLLHKKECRNIANPENSMFDKIDFPLSEKGTPGESATQIKPQMKDIELRPHSIETFSVEYRQVVDYPIDLYYLVDTSYSMKEHKDMLKDLGEKFATGIRDISSIFSLGVGFFRDQNENSVSILRNPMFKQKVKLTTMPPEEFQKAVLGSLSKFGDPEEYTNVSYPVGTLNAIMEAVVCKETHWRSDSKKLVVVATGNHFHYAGDGKLRGSVKPYDSTCHSVSGGYNPLQDYPSLSQLNRKIKEHNITLLFVVTDDLLDVYRNLSNILFGSVTGRLEDIDGVMQLIKEQYEAMSTVIEMTDTAQGSGNIEISYNSKCLDGENKKRNVCKGVKPGDTVVFDVTIKYSSCPENHKVTEDTTVTIQAAGRASKLAIELKMICGCPCERRNRGYTERCSWNGAYMCGICYCSNYTYGTECECDGVEGQTEQDERACKRGTDEHLCSNRGECRCGKCFCNRVEEHEEAKYYGNYCECSDYSCYQINNKMCNGHGSCSCGKCTCEDGWSGLDCTCTNTTKNCFAPDEDIMCSGHGTCDCGSCKCSETYYGHLCEDCPSCPGKCEEYGVCVKCKLSAQDDEIKDKECEEICRVKHVRHIELVDIVEEENGGLQEKLCSIQDEDGCHIYFKYEKGNKTTVIHAQRRIECPEPPDVVAIVAGTIGSIVIAGLILLLMWKCLTYVHDRREFAKFEKERQLAKWDTGQNPIFIQPSTTFENPAYGTS